MDAIESSWRNSVQRALSHASEMANKVDEGAADMILTEGEKFAALPAPQNPVEQEIRQRQSQVLDDRLRSIGHADEMSRECPEMRAEVFDAIRQVLNFTYPTTPIQAEAERCRQAGVMSLIREVSNGANMQLVAAPSTV